METISSRLQQFTSKFSLGPKNNRVSVCSRNFNMRLCGPLEVTKAIKRLYEEEVTKHRATTEIISMGMMQRLTSGWGRLDISSRDAFVLMFYTDDEDSFMAISDFRDAILNFAPDSVTIPMVIVGYHRDSNMRSMSLSQTVKRLVHEVWRQTYRQVDAGSHEDLQLVVQDILNTPSCT